MKSIYFFLATITSLIILQGCETEVDLNADYKSTTIVYGLLDPVQDTQWIKINRTFLGEGNNLDYALIRDSSEYKWDEFNSIRVHAIEDGEIVTTYTLQEKEISTKSINGIFYGPAQTVYYFPTPSGLVAGRTYRLDIDFKERQDVSAQTQLVTPSQISFLNAAGLQVRSIPLVQRTSDISFDYKTYTGSLNPDESAPIYEVALRIYFTEKTYTDASHTILVSERPVSLEYRLGSFNSNDINSLGRIPFGINGENIFQYIGGSLKSDDNIVYQIGEFDPTNTPFEGTVAMELVAYAGGEELFTYNQVNSPTTGIIQERPTYTNVNNGIGLLSSRTEIRLKDIPMTVIDPSLTANTSNLLALRYSEYTSDINFCDPGAEATEFIPVCP